MKSKNLIDITGNEYGFLKVVKFLRTDDRRRSIWECECLRCGKHVALRKDHFAYPWSRVKSCGCWHIEESKMRAKRSYNKATRKFARVNREGENNINEIIAEAKKGRN
jgi:hypothetical protein